MHIKPGDHSVATYSRDVLAGPLRILDGILEKVRNGKFLPSSARSGRFPEDEGLAPTSIKERFWDYMQNKFSKTCATPSSSSNALEELEDFGLETETRLEMPSAADESAIAEKNDDSSRSSDSSSSDESDSIKELTEPEEVMEKLSASTEPNLTSRVVEGLWKVRGGAYHTIGDRSPTKSKCGTSVGQRAHVVIHEPRFFSPLCRKCFPNGLVDES